MPGADVPKSKVFRCGKADTKYVFDVCKAEQIRANIITRMVIRPILETANFNLQCPFEIRENYTITNFSLPESFIPNWLSQQKFCVDVLVKAQRTGEKKFRDLVLFRIWVRFGKRLMN